MLHCYNVTSGKWLSNSNVTQPARLPADHRSADVQIILKHSFGLSEGAELAQLWAYRRSSKLVLVSELMTEEAGKF